MAAAIIEFDPLPNAVRSAAQNHDLGPRLGVRFVFVFVGGIEVRREGFEFRRAGIDALEHRGHAVAGALQPHRSRCRSPDLCQLLIARPVSLHFAQQFLGSRLNGHSRGTPVHRRQLFNLLDEPRIDFRQLTNLLG